LRDVLTLKTKIDAQRADYGGACRRREDLKQRYGFYEVSIHAIHKLHEGIGFS
jgi:hypothetical protein